MVSISNIHGLDFVTHHHHYIIIDAAEIFEPSERITYYTEEGENITLRCIGVGHPPPLVQWKKIDGSLSDRVSTTNTLISTNEGNVTRVTVDLILTKVSREDSGVYECLAKNLLNDATRNISLIVRCMHVILYKHWL